MNKCSNYEFSDLGILFLPLTGPVQERLQPGSPAAAVLQVSLQSTQDVRGELPSTAATTASMCQFKSALKQKAF